jgi:hypothetical protein
MKNGREAGAILRKEKPLAGRLRPPAASFVRSRDVVIRLELQPPPEPGAGKADQDKARDDEDDMQHAGSDAGNRGKVQMAGRLTRSAEFRDGCGSRPLEQIRREAKPAWRMIER